MNVIQIIRIVGLTAMAVLTGCATAPDGARIVDSVADLPSMQADNADRLAKIRTGMSIDEFRAVFPEANLAGQNFAVTAYEVARTQRYVTNADITRQNIIWGVGSPSPRSVKQALWFYFSDGHLVRWGQPQDWPSQSAK